MPPPIDRLPILTSLRSLIGQSRWVVFLHPERLRLAVAQWGDSAGAQGGWLHPCHFFDGSEETVRWIFSLDVLNHCFWPDVGKPPWTVNYQGQKHSGYWGLAASLKRAVERGFRITEPEFLVELSDTDLREILSGEGEIPLFEERLSNLREAGRVLLSSWNGDIVHLLEETRGSAVKTVQRVVSSFPSFQDEAQYQGQTVFFWKRAQLFVADLHAAFSGQGWGRYDDIHELTAFADYKLPGA